FSGDHFDAPPGILVAAGPGIRPGVIEGARLQDIAPTVLALLGLPVARELPGRVLRELVAAPLDVAFVPTYRDLQRDPSSSPAARDLDSAVHERLRALGYLE